MKIHNLQFPDYEEKKRFDEPYSPKLGLNQPIDLENIVSIGLAKPIDNGHHHRSSIISFSFTIYLKIGQPIVFGYEIPYETMGIFDASTSIDYSVANISKFLDEQREKLITAWTNQ